MKNMWRIVAAGILSFSFAFGGCGGGGSDGSGSAPAPSRAASTHSAVPGRASNGLATTPGQVPAPKSIYLHGRLVRGLDNFKGSCFINAALQVIAHDDVLRKRVLTAHAAPEIHTFFARYDQADADLTQAHADLVTHIRKVGHMPLGAGYTEVVLDLLGAGYTAIWLKELGAIVTHLGAGEHHFNVSAVSDQLNRRFDGMPENARMQHFIHYTGGHYLSYFRDGEQWIEANDASVKVVDTTTIAALSNKPVGSAAYSGIAFAAYQ